MNDNDILGLSRDAIAWHGTALAVVSKPEQAQLMDEWLHVAADGVRQHLTIPIGALQTGGSGHPPDRHPVARHVLYHHCAASMKMLEEREGYWELLDALYKHKGWFEIEPLAQPDPNGCRTKLTITFSR